MRLATILLLACVSTVARADLSTTIATLDPDGTRESFQGILSDMERDAEYAARVLDHVDHRFAALTDTLVQFVGMTEAIATSRFDGLYVPNDLDRDVEEWAPQWFELQWQGLLVLERIAPDPGVARDVRFRSDLRRALDAVERRQRAAVAGVVEVVRRWWAERGDDPTLTHDASRIPDIDAWTARLDAPADDPDVWAAPWMLADLDADPVLRVRVARRIDPDRHAHLAAELVESLLTYPEGFTEVGIERPHWDPERGVTVGHTAADLWSIAVEILERCTGRPFSGADETIRRMAAVAWWESAKYQARYWRDPRDAPSLARYVERGLVRGDGTPRRAAEWARDVYLERGMHDVILDRLGPEHHGAVGELIALLPMPKDVAHVSGFAQAYRATRFDRPDAMQRVAIDWDSARAFIRRMLTRLTGVEEPAGIAQLPVGAQASFWLDWWAMHRDEPQWSRAGFELPDVPESETTGPLFEPQRGRID